MLPSQRHLFDMPAGLAYLNAAAYGPLPRAVAAAGLAGVTTKSRPWTLDRSGDDPLTEQARAAAARIIGATADDIAIIPAVSYGVAVAARNLSLERGTRVLMMANEFPSLAIACRQMAAQHGGVVDEVARPADSDWTAALLAQIARPGPPVGLAALTPLHWTDGALVDLARIAPALRHQGAALVVDATQAAGVMPIDVTSLAPDFLVFPTYKWVLGPYSLAFLYAAPWRQQGQPLEHHAQSRHPGGDFLAGARRYDCGERSNPVALPMAVAGLGMMADWGAAAIAERLRSLTDALAEAAVAHGLAALPRPWRSPHVLGLRFPGGMPADAIAKLAARQVHVSDRHGVLRVSPHVYNEPADVAQFAASLAGLITIQGAIKSN